MLMLSNELLKHAKFEDTNYQNIIQVFQDKTKIFVYVLYYTSRKVKRYIN